jgi:hypothetical protein
MSNRRLTLLVLSGLICLMPTIVMAQQPTDSPRHAFFPPELQVSDPNIRRLLDSIETLAASGKFTDCLPIYVDALGVATKDRSLADRGIVEDKFAAYYFRQGKIEDAKSQWVNSLSTVNG